MRISKKTVINLLLIGFVVSFFVTPIGYHGKIFLNRLFSFSPEIISEDRAVQIPDYNWQLKDAEWNFFDFNQSAGKVVFINFWASWRLPSQAELRSIQNLYDRYGDRIDFYVITDEERPPVEEFMAKEEFGFPVTYLIIGADSPLEVKTPPASYVLDKNGKVRVSQEGIAKWDTGAVYELMDELLAN